MSLDYGLALANCALMNIPPGEAGRLSLHDYEALLYHWNKMHGGGDAGPPESKVPWEVTKGMMDRIKNDASLSRKTKLPV